MKEQVENTGIGLTELLGQVQQTLQQHLARHYWISAEINELKMHSTGHVYLVLVEKDEKGEQLKAKINATIWASAFRLIKPYFESTTGRSLAAGLKVLIKVNVQYHSLFGISLNITDIEPAYTIGSLAQQRQHTIARLEREGVFDMNRELAFPILPQRIAVISSEQAAGYQDFMHQLYHNEYGFAFRVTLFSAAVQGSAAAGDMIEALDMINSCSSAFDAVAIIRGGGATADLACFDDYALAAHVAQFPLPILTGIGHNKDESVVDMVAHLSLKTPTAVADYLIDCLASEAGTLDTYGAALHEVATGLIHRESQLLLLLQQQSKLFAQQLLQREKFGLQLQANDMESYNPYNILARGYAVVRKNGKAVLEASGVQAGDSLEITLHKGVLHVTGQ